MAVKSQTTRDALSVSAAIRLVKEELDALPLCIEGEVSQVSNKPGYKAVYFTIKDKSAALPCMMWVNRYSQANVELKVGALVRVTGKLSIYAAKGTMNFEVSSLKLAGEGDIRLKIAQLAEKLTKEGLTDVRRKRAIPALPEKIGLVTSPRGAAVHDVLRTLRRRYPFAQVLLAGVPVEGADAPRYLVAGMKTVVDAGAELVLVVRGGGSFEDLMPFNDERLARTIAACPVPVVTGIGHEPDTTIADLVSDLRCSTPTAAAEAVSPEDGYLENALTQSAAKMKSCVERKLHLETLRLDGQVRRSLFRDSQALLSQEWMGLDYSAERLSRAIPLNIMRDKSSLDAAQASLRKLSTTLVAVDKQRVADTSQRASKAIAANLDRFGARLSLAAAQVNSLSPLAVLGRGYSIVFNGEGGVVHNAGAVHVGDDVHVRLGKGSLSCKVNAIDAEDHAHDKEKQ